MKTVIIEASQILLALAFFALLAILWVAKRVIFLLFLFGLCLPMLNENMLDSLLQSPRFVWAAPFLTWLMQHGLRLCLILLFLCTLILLQRLKRLAFYQQKQNLILGGLASYLEFLDYQCDLGIEKRRRATSAKALCWLDIKQRISGFFGHLMFGRGDIGAWDYFSGTDLFKTVPKREGKLVTLRADIRASLGQKA